MTEKVAAEKDAQAETIRVDRESLFHVLQALAGPPHVIRELQVTRGAPFDNPIDTLVKQYYAGGVSEPEPETQWLPYAIFSTLVDGEGRVIKEQCISTMTPEATYTAMENAAALHTTDMPPTTSLSALIAQAADAARLRTTIENVVHHFELPREVLSILDDALNLGPSA